MYIGVDLGGTNIKVGVFDAELNLLGKNSKTTQADMGPKIVVERIAEAVNELANQHGTGLEAVKAVGIGAPGPSDISVGLIVAAPNLPLFRNVPLRDMLSKELNKPVVFENDANAACWGEFVCGAGKGVEDMVFFTLGTGIGGGVVSNGKLVHGFHDGAAELGHIIIYPDGRVCGCGQRGCAEAYASASSTGRRATEMIAVGRKSSLKAVFDEKGEVTSRDVFEHYARRDELAKEIAEDTAKALGLLCINVLHVTEPQRIVFSGGMIAAGDLLLSRIQYYFDKYIWTLKKEAVDICFATLGEDAGIRGAAALAKEQP
ncbi:MAG: ROK family protein [Phycisphaerae bacterium]|nr:ROK family protein [Phycisphaerae bacterium]